MCNLTALKNVGKKMGMDLKFWAKLGSAQTSPPFDALRVSCRRQFPAGPAAKISAAMWVGVLVAFPGTGASLFEGEPVTKPANEVDRLVFAGLERLHIPPANVCSDAVFVRRVYLDVIGTLPSAAEAQAFLLNYSPHKRSVLIDQLLERDEFADYWAMKWSDTLRVKAEFPVNLWPNAAQAYHRWIHTALRENRPYDQFARELLTASGSNFREPAVNFYRAMQNHEPQGIAQTVALTFMGARADKWPKERLDGMAAFFASIGYKSTAEWKEEIVFHNLGNPQAPTEAVFPDGRKVRLSRDQDPRAVFADWLVNPKNPWFARNAANRTWAWLLGNGIVQEPDDLRPDNPPVNPALLAFLEVELVSARYDLKHLYRVILNSQTYQLAAIPKSEDPRAEANFSFYPVRRLDAEVLIDALCRLTGSTEKYTSAIPEPFTFIPEDHRAITLPDGSITSLFLELFGRPARDTGLQSERNHRITAAQRLHLLNSSHIQRKLEQSRMVQHLANPKADPREIVNGLYLAILSRFPSEAESNTVLGHIKESGNRKRDAAVDVVWALINNPEFLYRH